jgi:hypothetical protein
MCWWENNIKMDLRELGCENMVLDCPLVVKLVMNLQVPQVEGVS